MAEATAEVEIAKVKSEAAYGVIKTSNTPIVAATSTNSIHVGAQ